MTQLTRRSALAGLATLGTAAAFSRPVWAAQDLSGVTLRVADQAGATWSKLKAIGFLDALPYRLEWSVFPAAVNIHEALKANAADIGQAGSGPTVAAIASGSPVKIVGGWDTGGRGVYLLVPQTSVIKNLADLRGKTISPTGRGSAGHYIVIQALKRAGLSANDVKLAFLEPASAASAFSTGTIDAWGTWGIYGIRALGSMNARTLIDLTTLRPEIYTVSATKIALADANKRAAIAHFIDLVERGREWTRQHRDEHIAWYQSFAKQDIETAAKAWDDEIVYRRLAVNDDFVTRLQDTFATWVEGGVLKGAFDMNTAIDRNLPIG